MSVVFVFLQDLVQAFCKGFADDVPAGGISQGVAQDFLHDFCRCFCSVFSRENLSECLQKPSGRVPGASPEPPRTVPERLQTASQNNFKKIMPNVLRTLDDFALWGSFWSLLAPSGASWGHLCQPLGPMRDQGRPARRWQLAAASGSQP